MIWIHRDSRALPEKQRMCHYRLAWNRRLRQLVVAAEEQATVAAQGSAAVVAETSEIGRHHK